MKILGVIFLVVAMVLPLSASSEDCGLVIIPGKGLPPVCRSETRLSLACYEGEINQFTHRYDWECGVEPADLRINFEWSVTGPATLATVTGYENTPWQEVRCSKVENGWVSVTVKTTNTSPRLGTVKTVWCGPAY